jgi:hypothetical protein
MIKKIMKIFEYKTTWGERVCGATLTKIRTE